MKWCGTTRTQMTNFFREFLISNTCSEATITNTQHSYNLRDRSHNYSLISKDAPINDRHFIVRLLYKHSYLLLSYFSCHHLFVKLRSVNFILNEYWIGLDWKLFTRNWPPRCPQKNSKVIYFVASACEDSNRLYIKLWLHIFHHSTTVELI